jgi:hypothetical protein
VGDDGNCCGDLSLLLVLEVATASTLHTTCSVHQIARTFCCINCRGCRHYDGSYGGRQSENGNDGHRCSAVRCTTIVSSSMTATQCYALCITEFGTIYIHKVAVCADDFAACPRRQIRVVSCNNSRAAAAAGSDAKKPLVYIQPHPELVYWYRLHTYWGNASLSLLVVLSVLGGLHITENKAVPPTASEHGEHRRIPEDGIHCEHIMRM